MVHVVGLGCTILIIAVQFLYRLFHQGNEVGSTIMTVLLDCIGKTQGSHTRNVRTSHRGSLHVAIGRLAVLNQGREHSTFLLGCCLCPVFIFLFTNLAVVFQVATRSAQGYERTEVGVAGWSKVGSYRRYADALRVSTWESRIASILVTGCEDRNTAVDDSIRRTCIVDEVIQSFLLQRISLSPFLLSSRTRSITVDDARL